MTPAVLEFDMPGTAYGLTLQLGTSYSCITCAKILMNIKTELLGAEEKAN